MALRIKNPKMIITPSDRVIRESEAVWLRPYFPVSTQAQVELVFYDKAKEYIKDQLSQQALGVIVANINISLGEENFYDVLHTKVIEYLMTIDSTLELEKFDFIGEQAPAPEPEPEVEPTPEPTPEPEVDPEVEEEF